MAHFSAASLRRGVAALTGEGPAFHEPVMVEEVIELLAPSGGRMYLDGTVGGGGHARALLERCPGCFLVAVDRDPHAVEAASAALEPFADRVEVRQRRFDEAADLPALRYRPLSGALLDLGVSSHQLDEEQRGFTFRSGALLDMRMGGEGEGGPGAAELLNEAREERLMRIFREFGEEPRARKLAEAVVRRRADRPLRTSDDLVEVLESLPGRGPRTKDKARIFQALRIAVNDELGILAGALPTLRDALAAGGALAVISYQSLEDRLVKHAFRDWSRSCLCPPGIPVCTCRGTPLGEVLAGGLVRPSAEEITRNPRARSARLRGWRKTL